MESVAHRGREQIGGICLAPSPALVSNKSKRKRTAPRLLQAPIHAARVCRVHRARDGTMPLGSLPYRVRRLLLCVRELRYHTDPSLQSSPYATLESADPNCPHLCPSHHVEQSTLLYATCTLFCPSIPHIDRAYECACQDDIPSPIWPTDDDYRSPVVVRWPARIKVPKMCLPTSRSRRVG